MDAERLAIISTDNTPAGRLPGRPKRRWSDLIPDLNKAESPITNKKENTFILSIIDDKSKSSVYLFVNTRVLMPTLIALSAMCPTLLATDASVTYFLFLRHFDGRYCTIMHVCTRRRQG